MKTIEEIRAGRKTRRAAFVAHYRQDSRFENLRTTYFSRGWMTIGQLAEYVRQSWCDRIVTDTDMMWFSLESKNDQYAIVQALVNDETKWDHCLGSDDGREVRVYKAI